ncbi:unnamed protein product [Didymodactylos carnosus]|uniref:Uncharacterized protein n=1 Tax=Didymodactylos carnosus TaxID=1234261 RepID=A0A816DQF9_9BILA|nr:unnamed protein product [Didymodactylos carnosus]CAF1640513.1 unnamed protein product [Didymodactylos carnosus]CAF4286734.1 unnamed protein product [Didymodactylos carnosus]CAF4551755.1 unnamed protein product [Didymodactylos carnosus]
MQRYDRSTRWTGILESLPGNEYYIIEGLNDRTTNIDYKSANEVGRNDKYFLSICLYTHALLDLVIVMLDIEDLKERI